MSETISKPAALAPRDWTGGIFGHVHAAARWAMDGLQHLGDEWAAIEKNAAYGPLVQMAVAMAMKGLAAENIPVGDLVNAGLAVKSTLAALAATHPAIRTPG